ncbi:transposase, partial [mine drainage metagenome]
CTEALDEVRKEVWRNVKKIGVPSVTARIKGCRYALLKNPENLTTRQVATLAKVAKLNNPLYRAYLLKEQFRLIFKLR